MQLRVAGLAVRSAQVPSFDAHPVVLVFHARTAWRVHGSQMLSLDRLKSFLAADPANVELACSVVDLQVDVGQFREAEHVLAGLPDAVQALPGVLFRRARIALVVGDYAAAEARLRQLSAAGHDAPAIAHDLAFALLCQRRLDEAREVLEQAQHANGVSVELLILRARVALMARDFAQAEQALNEALALAPGNDTALGLRALGRLDAGDTQGAGEAAMQCLALFPDQHEALLTAGTLALWQRDDAAAHAHFSRALQRFPNSGRALSGMGQLHMLATELDTARDVLVHAVQTMPDHIGTWHALGWTQLLLGDLAAAEDAYRAALELDRNFADSHGGVAVVELLQGRQAEGELSMRRALKLDPRCASGRYARTLWLDLQGEVAQSTALFAELIGEGALPGVEGQDPQVLASRLKARILSRRDPR